MTDAIAEPDTAEYTWCYVLPSDSANHAESLATTQDGSDPNGVKAVIVQFGGWYKNLAAHVPPHLNGLGLPVRWTKRFISVALLPADVAKIEETCNKHEEWASDVQNMSSELYLMNFIHKPGKDKGEVIGSNPNAAEITQKEAIKIAKLANSGDVLALLPDDVDMERAGQGVQAMWVEELPEPGSSASSKAKASRGKGGQNGTGRRGADISPELAKQVEAMYELHGTVTQTKHALNNAGVPVYTGGQQWYRQNVEKALAAAGLDVANLKSIEADNRKQRAADNRAKRTQAQKNAKAKAEAAETAAEAAANAE